MCGRKQFIYILVEIVLISLGAYEISCAVEKELQGDNGNRVSLWAITLGCFFFFLGPLILTCHFDTHHFNDSGKYNQNSYIAVCVVGMIFNALGCLLRCQVQCNVQASSLSILGFSLLLCTGVLSVIGIFVCICCPRKTSELNKRYPHYTFPGNPEDAEEEI